MTIPTKRLTDEAVISPVPAGATLFGTRTVNGSVEVVQYSRDDVETALSSAQAFTNPENAAPTDGIPTTIGALTAGTVIHGLQPAEILQQMLFPNPVPSISAFSISGTTTVLVGTTLSGTKTFNKTIVNPSLIDGLLTLAQEGIVLPLRTDVPAASGSFTADLTSVVRNTAGTKTLTLSGSYDGTPISRTAVYTWGWPYYAGSDLGETTSVTYVEAQALTGSFSIPTSGTTKSVVVSANATRVIMAVPSTCPAATKAVSVNTNLNLLPLMTVQTITMYGANPSATATYTVYVYRSLAPLSADTVVFTF